MYSVHWYMHLYSNELNFIKVVAILEYKYFFIRHESLYDGVLIFLAIMNGLS